MGEPKHPTLKPFLSVAVATAAAVLVSACGISADVADPTGATPAPAEGRRLLDELAVAPEGSADGYDRDAFPHWETVAGSCDTREEALKRAAEPGSATVNPETCAVTDGSWRSPYDGATWTKSSDVDIDHVVPLAEAWRSGAAQWSKDAREAFANDLEHPQLLVVTDNVNQEKGDQDPGSWRPPLESYWCTYAESWIQVKHHYQLTLDPTEKAALADMLARC
ncbi:HNH endonuclease family protein [Saccharopolyspora sp. K220]|uniref:HNH endonuclease family protein n=1 Tax=Saccharopolyspora soli TaxID=2926618 RepID=UPI001F5ADE22|nr:HNH endonuclease family protein [Saccharopolyspora soli]MCI2422641.1 HNH endonuclease family protein [Saccharopolyspora soli]